MKPKLQRGIRDTAAAAHGALHRASLGSAEHRRVRTAYNFDSEPVTASPLATGRPQAVTDGHCESQVPKFAQARHTLGQNPSPDLVLFWPAWTQNPAVNVVLVTSCNLTLSDSAFRPQLRNRFWRS